MFSCYNISWEEIWSIALTCPKLMYLKLSKRIKKPMPKAGYEEFYIGNNHYKIEWKWRFCHYGVLYVLAKLVCTMRSQVSYFGLILLLWYCFTLCCSYNCVSFLCIEMEWKELKYLHSQFRFKFEKKEILINNILDFWFYFLPLDLFIEFGLV